MLTEDKVTWIAFTKDSSRITMLLDRKFPHIIPIRVDRRKVSCEQANLGRSRETFCILFQFR